MIGNTYGSISVAVNILLVLFMFAHVFNQTIDRLGHKAEGWTWLFVVIGVAATLLAVGALDLVLDWSAFFLCVLAFSVSGLPMIIGAVARHYEERSRAHKATRE